MQLLNDWPVEKVIHKNDILEFEFLMEKELIVEIAYDYFCLCKSFPEVETAFYKYKNSILEKELRITNVDKELKDLIKEMNDYNRLKDIAETLIGQIAELRGVPIKDIHKELDLPSENK